MSATTEQIKQTKHNGSVTIYLSLGYSVSSDEKLTKKTAAGSREDEATPYGGAKLTIYNEHDKQIKADMTHEDGSIEFNLPAGDYELILPIPEGLTTPLNTPLWEALDKTDKTPITSNGAVEKVKICIEGCSEKKIGFTIPARKTGFSQAIKTKSSDCGWTNCSDIVIGKTSVVESMLPESLKVKATGYVLTQGDVSLSLQDVSKDPSSGLYTVQIPAKNIMEGSFDITRSVYLADNSFFSLTSKARGVRNDQGISGEIKTSTSMTRTETSFTPDMAFWTGIRNSTEALSFNNYLSFMDWLFCGGAFPSNSRINDQAMRTKVDEMRNKRFLPFTDADAYRVVKAATEAFVMVNCGVLKPNPQDRDNNHYLDRRDLPQGGTTLTNSFSDYLVSAAGTTEKILPYLAVIRQKLPDIPIKFAAFEDANPGPSSDNCFGILQEKLANPCLLELIWSYWHEEGMLVQSMNAITRRFQNMRASDRDPLANMEIDPLRPLNNLIWSYIQDEQHRLNVSRRNYEYDHHYGLRLEGKAVQDFRPADTRSKFLEAFHHLLRLCTVFYKQDDNTMVKADAFPILNALKEVHLILSQGAHNQFGDLPSTARIEMLIQQWLLARPEFREFLPTRVMVAYPEPWMDRVDAMKKLQGWTNTSVLHFRDLGLFGEQLLLSIRWGHWSDEFEPVKAFNWARFFRPQVQGYIHAYRSATGVDLSADPTVNANVDSTLPSILLQKQLDNQQRAG